MTTLTTRQRLIDAAVEAFGDRGFNATTTRDIGSRAGMSAAAVYVHHESKESLLFLVSSRGHAEGLAAITAASEAHDEPRARLHAMVYDFTIWHAEHSRLAKVSQYELTSLTPEHRAEVGKVRRAIEKCMQNALTDGVESGAFDVEDVPGTALAILSLSVDLVRWFVPGGSRKASELAALNANLAIRMTARHRD